MSETSQKKRPGDRKEGRRLRSIDPYNIVACCIMKTRQDATNYFTDQIEISEIDRYIRKKRAEGMKGFGFLHVFIAAYLRTVSQRPALNRFVSGKRIFARKNIEVIMTVKKEMSSYGEETSIKVVFSPEDTSEVVYRRINEAVASVKEQNSTATDDVAGVLTKLPRFILSFALWFIDKLDYYGLIPQALLDASPFHGSLVITDLGSLGIPPIYHHLYDFGNVPLFLAFGAKRRGYEVDSDGNVSERKYLDYTISSDERICDGYYFAQSLKYMRSFMRHPEQLEVPPEQVIEDVD